MKSTVTQIVLLGGGYVSIWAYRSLIRKLRHEIDCNRIQITVICPEKYHFFHGWTAESLTCIIQDQNRMSPLSGLFAKALIIQACAEKIDAASKTVLIKMKDGLSQNIHYDHLLIGFGSFDSECIEGIHRYGYQVKSPEAFNHTKQTIKLLVEQAVNAEQSLAQKLLSFTIAGGGFTGVELATNIAEFITILKRQYPSLQKIRPSIRLISATPRVLSVLQSRFDRLIRYTEKTIKRYDIEVISNNKVIKVTEYGAHLSDGSFIQSSMVISTIGQSRMILKGTENMDRDIMNRLYTNSYLQIQKYSTIWGGGDACHVNNCLRMQACPSNALWAMKHGEHAGRNIAMAIKNKPLIAFKYKGLGQSASLGIGKGIGELYGIQFTGWIAWVMRFFVFNYFMPYRKVMFNEISDWLFLLFRRRRIGLHIQKESEKAEEIFDTKQPQLINLAGTQYPMKSTSR
ncbi:MAG: FAD-dependent oxidoreductase [Bacteroidia bacterium]|nr:FAD-dependent oxidoreductase [Bacteroidia bacterium]